MTARRLIAFAVVSALAFVAVPARGDKPAEAPAPKRVEPQYVDDADLLDQLVEKFGDLAKAEKCMDPTEMRKRIEKDFTYSIKATAPTEQRLDPEDVYEKILPSVFLVGSVVKNEDGDYQDGRLATAWVLAANGVLVTNWHVFDGAADDEHFAVMDHAGRAYPVKDILAVDRKADVAVFQVAAKNLKPLPLATRPARVGAWVGVLGHPGDRYFTFSQGTVSRYTQTKREDGEMERWMSITAEYAYGASGSPVLDRRGAVVGMAAMTESIDYPEDEPKPLDKDEKPKDKGDDKPKGKDDKPKGKGDDKIDPPMIRESRLQMVIKLTTPAAEIRSVIEAGE
ncbi:S1 family peptidase [Fimbriiglobus ruber]|uniref:Trypsin-like serine protease n=1 Tax=Fimbriiglobus ruber TaxID=1908690 RepID=A0A225EA24_9BACT|nr:serine protease [Fimbriiglobus ruber]OWK45267.1 Trypsin-like serine protease [Fimbriiglobus ruber]